MRKLLCNEYISYEDVMSQSEIFCVSSINGCFFLCFDYYAPAEAKLWYKFSIDPFDTDFLKFKKMDYGIITKDDFSNNGLEITFKYLHTCKTSEAHKNSNLLNEIFFRGGKPSITIKKLQDMKWSRKKLNKEDIYGKIELSRVYRLKSRLTTKVKTWLKRIYQEYNFLDNSIKYIKEYYNKWLILVETIQDQKESMISPLWRFIESYDIHSFDEFIEKYKKVVNKEIHIRGIGYDDILYFYGIITMIKKIE